MRRLYARLVLWLIAPAIELGRDRESRATENKRQLGRLVIEIAMSRGVQE